jgi:two-component system, NtrC family, nitrogen regulation sensor histidine kinase NtrY
MGSSRFASQLTVRLALLLATLVLLAYLIAATDMVAVVALVGGLAIAQAYFVIHFVHRTNRELDRLLAAIRHDDFQQSFSIGELGSTFADLGRTFEDVMQRFRAERLDREAQRRYLEALVEHVPVALLAVHDGGAVELLNNAARRLLDLAGDTTTQQLISHGAAFQRDLAQCKSGTRIVTRMVVDGVERHLILSATQIVVVGRASRLIALQDIQRELERSELSAWQDMARILSHEILNSLTPIASLARTGEDMVEELARRDGQGDGDELVADLGAALQTMARRSDGLMRFVRSYREFTQMPPPTLKPVALDEYLRRFEKLFLTEWAGRGVALEISPAPPGVTVLADDALLDQAVINLLRNAADAAVGGGAAGGAATAGKAPRVWLDARLSERGRPVIEIGDNGPGLDESLGDQIFLPFFTTKPEGSGIGLALARQVMLVHKGAISASQRPGGGALFRLIF